MKHGYGRRLFRREGKILFLGGSVESVRTIQISGAQIEPSAKIQAEQSSKFVIASIL